MSTGCPVWAGVFPALSSRWLLRLHPPPLSRRIVMAEHLEDYVRLRAGRDGGEFVVPAKALIEASATMRGMLESSGFREARCILQVPSQPPESQSAPLLAALRGGESSIAGVQQGAAAPGGELGAEDAEDGHRSGSSVKVIAVDGPAASGKGTLSRRLAERLQFAHLDTGSLYRATALRVLRAGVDPQTSVADGEHCTAAREASLITTQDLNDAELRQERVGQAASIISASPPVRKALLDFQHKFCTQPPGGLAGAVLDGRDIGTVVWPQAQVKLFVTAELDTRALRRWKELMDAGKKVILEDVRQEMITRDERDKQRATAPLKASPDAVTIDTSDMDPDACLDYAWKIVNEKLSL